jgi:hypothetical protein
MSAGIKGRANRVPSLPWPNTNRTYKAAIVQVLPVPALASINREPHRGNSNALSGNGNGKGNDIDIDIDLSA